MESFAESAERSEMELRNSDYDYSRFAIADDLETCLSGLSSAVGSVSMYSMPPSEVAVELNSAYSHLTEGVYSRYSLAPSEAEVEMSEGLSFPLTSAALSAGLKALSLDSFLQTAVSEVETGKFLSVLESLDDFLEAHERDSLDEMLQTANSEVDTAVQAGSIYSVYSLPPSEAAVEMAEASLYPQIFPGSAAELANPVMSLAPEAASFALTAIDSLVVDFGAPMKALSLEDLLQTAASDVDTAVRRDSLQSLLQTGVSEVATAVNRDSLHSLLQTGVSEVATAVNRDSLHSLLQTAVSEVNTAVSNWDAQSWEADLETCIDALSICSDYSEYSLPASEVEVEMAGDGSMLTFPLTTAFEMQKNDSFYALDALNPFNEHSPLQFRRSSQYVLGELHDFQVWHEDNKVDDTITVDPRSEQFVRLASKGAEKMFASTASEYCIDKLE